MPGTRGLLMGQERPGQTSKEGRPDTALPFRTKLKTPKQKQSVSSLGSTASACYENDVRFETVLIRAVDIGHRTTYHHTKMITI
jgi:hypothetical protein